MKIFEKFRSRALNQDALKQIKGGADPTPECMQAYLNCKYLCPPLSGDFGPWYDCLAINGPQCSPLEGWDLVCAS